MSVETDRELLERLDMELIEVQAPELPWETYCSKSKSFCLDLKLAYPRLRELARKGLEAEKTISILANSTTALLNRAEIAESKLATAQARIAELETAKEQLLSSLESSVCLLKIALDGMPNGAFRNAVQEEEMPNFKRTIDTARRKSSENAMVTCQVCGTDNSCEPDGFIPLCPKCTTEAARQKE